MPLTSITPMLLRAPAPDRDGGVDDAADAGQHDVLGRAWGDASVIEIGSAYESATHHRKPLPTFGPVPAKDKSPAIASAQ
jgi:hypothetical protein